MTRTSLRLRLLLAWAIFIALTLQVAGIGLRVLFERSITRRTQTELEADLRQIRRGMELSSDGVIRIVREPTDPQFDILMGGRYWQVMEGGKPIIRSRSLDQSTLDVVTTSVEDEPVEGPSWLIGPQREKLFAVLRRHSLDTTQEGTARDLIIVTAVDAAEISEDTDKFSADLWKSLVVLSGILFAGAWLHVSIGLRPLKTLSGNVGDVRAGRASRIEGNFPDEVMPLVQETNALLDAQEADLRVARERAGDLAHGLKTPLAIMGAAGRTLRRKGIDDVAQDIDRQIDVMRRHVDRELARARARGSCRMGLALVDISALLADLVGVIESLPRERELMWSLDVPDEVFIPFDADDFNNMVGNLLENAGKWAARNVFVSLSEGQGAVSLVVEDDGPGIPADQIERVLRRGERADTSVAGSGLGLAIVSDIVEIYRGCLTLSERPGGGLRAEITLRIEPRSEV